MHQLDCLTIGRSSVDLYGAQVGGRLEDMLSFEKYLGGSPTNMATGAARLGLKSGLITRVGDEHMGRFIREELVREGVDVSGVVTDPERLSALVILGIRDEEQFPLIFYRENCADMALCEADIDEALIARARSLVATGTHLSNPQTEAAVLKALTLARKHGARTALDIDYRPNLWGLSGHGDGENRFIASEKVTAKLQSTLSLFDLIVGTEEEFHIAGGTTDTLQALKNVRTVSAATLVLKRGADGASAFEGDIPDDIDGGVAGKSFRIEVFNVLGAGDGFMAGLLKGWLTDRNWRESLTIANACGAFAVSRHGCTPAYPSLTELEYFLEHGAETLALRKDKALEQLHWSTNRHGNWPQMRVFAFDHRIQLEEMAAQYGAPADRISAFKELCLKAVLSVADGKPGHGILCDNRLGRSALYKAAGTGLWIGRPTEWPGSRPLSLEPELGEDIGGLSEWPAEHVVKVLCFYHPDDNAPLKAEQEATLKRLFAAARRNRLEFLMEVVSSKHGETDDMTAARVIDRLYGIGIYPDWWKLEPLTSEAAWANVSTAIERNDRHTRGIVVLGLDAPEQELAASFATAARFPLVKGFAVGRSIFAETARAWLSGALGDDQAVAEMTEKYSRFCRYWDEARNRTEQHETQEAF
ncbi:5-dehydro-2-deoxygluconokinase [uncultured Martelella sp.]|uniref:bifunctional 5-dehydro-2-deoxygluconokinase/5-dehydro-2- deoxyphosphogluconate aldolase n=1 Tax=uncultured Martelella sp. TaxID=392331 RepID=UPI0029C9784C|nr:5-dehydro-2-deoxygluconokinase [uncultured Martelella sp.]